MKILYIGNKIDATKSGKDVINQRNQNILQEISGQELTYIECSDCSIFNKMFMCVDNDMLVKIDQCISNENYSHIFLSQSLLGRVAQYIGKHYKLPIITFFHNIEYDYANAYLKSRGIRALPFYVASIYWEKKTVEHSTKFITLNKRDSDRLKVVYNVESDIELPTSFNDKFDAGECDKWIKLYDKTIDYLFIGVAFFPNVQGVQWFIDNVMPYVSGTLYVIGKGMDNVKFHNLTDRIHIKGFVDNLEDYYYRAKIVISPIFTGAGMKTKTAEALMYGRTIVGTTEAFEGYEIDDNCMHLANSADEFINKLKILSATNDIFNLHSRQLFLNNYETSQIKDRLFSIL